MKIQKLLEIAFAIDVALIERQIQGQIGSYVMDVCPDDGRIEVITTCIKTLKKINCTVKLGSSVENNHSRK